MEHHRDKIRGKRGLRNFLVQPLILQMKKLRPEKVRSLALVFTGGRSEGCILSSSKSITSCFAFYTEPSTEVYPE